MITARTEVFALIGDPVEKSLSPVMYNAAFRFFEMDSVYVALRVPPSSLREAVSGMRAMGIKGFNVTHPHKTKILRLLDGLDQSAEEVGAVNTVRRVGNKLVGFNTDGQGAIKFLKEEIGSLKGKKVVILGAGGAARALAFTLTREGANLTIANRTVSKARRLVSELEGIEVELSWCGLERRVLRKILKEADVLVNATPVGMGGRETLVRSDMMDSSLFVFDLIYYPLETALMREARKAGAKAVNGLGMLINQAVLAFKIFTGKDVPPRVLKEAVRLQLGKIGVNYPSLKDGLAG